MRGKSLRRLAETALIAGAYAALSLALAPLAFGPVQCRVSEALTMLTVLTPAAVPGVTVGCLITNAVGIASGANVLGLLDLLCGTAATFSAALCSRALRRIRIRSVPVLSALPPVLFNAVIVGAEWCVAATGSLGPPFWICAWQIALGELPPVFLGLVLAGELEKRGLPPP